MTKYRQFANVENNRIEETAASASEAVSFYAIEESSPNRIAFIKGDREIGYMNWDDGAVCFNNDYEESTVKFITMAQMEVHEHIQQVRREVKEVRELLARMVSVLSPEQFEDIRVKDVVDYLHQHEFFENKIRGS